jgi:hypothetical protein
VAPIPTMAEITVAVMAISSARLATFSCVCSFWSVINSKASDTQLFASFYQKMAANLKIIKKLHFISIFISSFCAELIFGGNKGGFLQTPKKALLVILEGLFYV